ncbi:hypothetical protein KCU99_g331, partial [Aureobasidium melanogenum]
MPQQRLRGTLWPRLGTLTRLPSEVKDRVGPLVIILDHNGVPQSLGSRREDKLTWNVRQELQTTRGHYWTSANSSSLGVLMLLRIISLPRATKSCLSM